MGNLYFTADLHCFHANIIKYCNRDFFTSEEKKLHDSKQQFTPSRESVERMNECIFEGINKTVKPGDTLWLLGDFCFAPKGDYYSTTMYCLNRINTKDVRIVWGNHDKPEKQKVLFKESHFLHELNGYGQMIVLCHYAMAAWNKHHKGSWCLYGHSHSNAEFGLDKALPGRRSLDVGVDNAFKLLGEYRPFSFDEIKKIMDKRPGHNIDHHTNRHHTNNED